LTKHSVPKTQQVCKPQPNPEVIRRVILGELHRVFRDRHGPEFPDNEAGHRDLDILLRYHALHPTHGREKMRHTIETRASWMKEDEVEMTISDLTVLDPRYLRLKPEELRDRIWLSSADRERLRAWHVPPFDKTEKELARYRKARRNDQETLRRRGAGAMPRADYELESLSRSKPWESEGVSRATWYRTRDKCAASAEEPRSIAPLNGQAHTLTSKSRPCETSPRLGEKVLAATDLSQGVNETQTERSEQHDRRDY
jgi:hypothetical protein